MPIAFAHRGGSTESENGLSAFRNVERLGYRYVETDVRTTRDGVPAIFHDDDLGRMTGRAGLVEDVTLAELKQLALPDGDAIPTLGEALDAFPDLRFNIDIKDDAGVEPVVQLLRDRDALERVCVASFSEPRLARARELLGPQVCTGLGVGGVVRAAVAALLPGRGDGLPPGVGVLQLPLRWHGVRVVTRGIVERAHAAGVAVHVWTLNDAPSIRTALDAGVDGVMTDEPELLKRLLVERGQWHTGHDTAVG